MARKTKYFWSHSTRLHLVKVVLKAKHQNGGKTRWSKIARDMPSQSGLDNQRLAMLCGKQFDNLYRAYCRWVQDGKQGSTLSDDIIKEFSRVYPRDKTIVATAGSGKRRRGLACIQSNRRRTCVRRNNNHDDTVDKEQGNFGSTPLVWNNFTSLQLARAIKAKIAGSGKVPWKEVAASLVGVTGITDDSFEFSCIRQFDQLCSDYKQLKTAGDQTGVLSPNVIGLFDDLFETHPGLSPLHDHQSVRDTSHLGLKEIRNVESNLRDSFNVRHGADSRISSEQHVRRPDSPSSDKSDRPCAAFNSQYSKVAEETHGSSSLRPSEDANSASRQEDLVSLKPEDKRNCTISGSTTGGDQSAKNQQGNPTGEFKENYKAFARELELLEGWLKEEAMSASRELLCKLSAEGPKANGNEGQSKEINGFDELILGASRKETDLLIQAKIQRAKQSILKDLKDMVMGADLTFRKSSV